MNKLERPIQYGLGGDFGGIQPSDHIEKKKPKKKNVEKFSDHPEAPLGTTHFVAEGKDVFFASDPHRKSPRPSYESAYFVRQKFYAEHVADEGPWKYFKITGISNKDAVPHASFWRDGVYNLIAGVKFRTKASSTKKLE